MLSPKFVDKLLVTKLTNQLKDMESELQYVRKSLRQLDGAMLSAVKEAIGTSVGSECMSLAEAISDLTVAVEEELVDIVERRQDG